MHSTKFSSRRNVMTVLWTRIHFAMDGPVAPLGDSSAPW